MQTIGSTFEARHQNGFTLVELLIATVIISILAAIGIPQFSKTKEKAYDTAAMSDIRRAQLAAEDYFYANMTYPASEVDLGWIPSPGVTFTRWQLQTQNGVLSIHIHAQHAQSTHFYHSHYPAEGILVQKDIN